MSETHGNPSDHHSHDPPAPPEPKTPMWLPALGAVLFLTAALIWGFMPESKPEASDTANTAQGSATDTGAPARN